MKHLFTLILLSLLLVTSCSEKSDTKGETERHANSKCLAVASVPTMDCLPLFVAYESHFADALGYTMAMKEYMSLIDCVEAYKHGKVSAIPSDCQYAAKLRNDTNVILDNDNVVLTMFLNHRARLKEAKQLSDKMVACSRYGVSGIMAQHVLDSVGLKDDKTFLVNFPDLQVRLKMMENNEMDAVVTPEPQSSIIKKAGNASVYSASRLNGQVIGRFVMRAKTSDIIRKIYNRACDSINAKGIHAYDSIIVKRLYVPESALQSLPNIKYKKL